MRSIESIESAKAALSSKKTTTAVSSLPPGYYQGFRIYTQDYQLIIGKGVMNCRGTAVYHRSERVVDGSEYLDPDELITGFTYYIYMNKTKEVLVDVVDGIYDDTNFGFYHPSLYQYRLLGQFTLVRDADGHWTYTDIVTQDPVLGSDIIADSIVARHLTTGSVGTTKIADDSISTAKLQADSITAAKIAADAIEAEHMSADAAEFGLLNATTAYIGFNSFSGTSTLLSPGEGDTVVRYSNMSIEFLEYTNGGWTTVNGAKIGGFVSGLFLAMVGACGLYHPSNPPTNTEQLPNPNFRVFNFENNYNDQNGLDDWAAKTNGAFSSSVKKFGSYSLFATSGNYCILTAPGGADITNGQAAAVWIYISSATDVAANWNILGLDNAGSTDQIRIQIGNSEDLLLYVEKNSSQKYNTSVPITKDEWHYVGFTYVVSTDSMVFVIDNTLYNTGALGGSWAGGALTLRVTTANAYSSALGDFTHYADELLYFYDKYLSPELIAQHYIHNTAWATAYSKADILIRPNTDGRLMLRRVANDNKQVLTWVPVTNPTAGWLASKTSGWTADRFTTGTGGMLVDFSSVVSAGTKAVICNLYNTTTTAPVYARPAGDDTYASNTPNANTEYFACIAGTTNRQQVRIPLNAAYQAEIAVADTGVDVYISNPIAELR